MRLRTSATPRKQLVAWCYFRTNASLPLLEWMGAGYEARSELHPGAP